MTNAESEFYKQFAASIVRKLLVIIGTTLAGHGWIRAEQAEGLTRAAAVEFVVSFIFVFGSAAWAWAKVKFNVGAVREARSSPSDTPIGVITSETLSKSSFISSV